MAKKKTLKSVLKALKPYIKLIIATVFITVPTSLGLWFIISTAKELIVATFNLNPLHKILLGFVLLAFGAILSKILLKHMKTALKQIKQIKKARR